MYSFYNLHLLRVILRGSDEGKGNKILISNFYNNGYSQWNTREYISNTYFKSGAINTNIIPNKTFGFELKVDPKTLQCEIILTELFHKDGVFTIEYRDTFRGIKIK